VTDIQERVARDIRDAVYRVSVDEVGDDHAMAYADVARIAFEQALRGLVVTTSETAAIGEAVERFLNTWGKPASIEIMFLGWSEEERWYVRAAKPDRAKYARMVSKHATGATVHEAIAAAIGEKP